MPLFELVTKYGEKRPKLRRELTILAGGRAEFQKLRQQGAGGSRAPFGGKRQVGRIAKTAVVASIDDSKVPTVKSMKKSKGWEFRAIYVGPGKQTQVLIAKSPKTGKEYIKCDANEKADLIHLNDPAWHMPPIRLKLYVESKLAKKALKAEQQDDQRADEGFERRLAKKQEKKKRTKKIRRAR